MATHEHNGHGHGHHGADTEGNRQYYPKGWHLPLVGLLVVAMGFALLGGWIFSISGTDKWGKTHATEDAHHHGAPALDQEHHEDMKPLQDPKQHDQDTAKRVDTAKGVSTDSVITNDQQRSPGERAPHEGRDVQNPGHDH